MGQVYLFYIVPYEFQHNCTSYILRSLRAEVEKWNKQSANNRSSDLGQIEMTNDGYVKYKAKDGKEDEGEDDEYQDLNH